MAQSFDGSLIFDTQIDTDGFERGANTIRNEASTLRGALSGLAKYFSVAVIIGGLAKLGSQAIETASDLQEVQNVVDTAFGNMSDKIERFSEDSVKAFGISELTAKQTASTFMSMGKGMDIAADSASNMAVALTGRMGDMMSFYNQTSDVVSTALNGIYTGETEALKRFGVVMTEANLNQYAYSQGITKAVNEMSQAEKVTLRYNFVMAKTSLAQGDFAKTSESWANQTRVLKEEFKVLLGTLGNGLIQVLLPVLRLVNTLLTSLINMANFVGDIFSSIFGTSKSIYNVVDNTSDAVSNATDGISDIGGAVSDAGKSVSKGLAPFDKLNQVTESIADNASGASDIRKIGDSFSSVTEGAQGTKLADTVKEAKEGIDGLSGAILGLIAAVGTYALITNFSKLTGLIGLLTTSPAGIIALAVGGLVWLGVTIWDQWQKTKEKDLAERFGDITLSVEEMGKVAKEIVDNGTFDKLGIAANEWADLSGLEGDIEASVNTINKLNWKVQVGMELTQEEQEQYKTAISTYIEKVQKYASEQKEAVLLSIDLLLSDGSTKDNITRKTNEFYNAVEGELARLGNELSDTVTKAWEDGLLTIDETKKINEIQGQMNNIMKELATSEYNANLEMIKMKFSGVDLTPETFKELEKMIGDTVQTYVDDYDETVVNTVASLDTQLRADNITTEEYDAAIKNLKDTRLSNIGTISLNATRFSVTTLTDAFNKEIGDTIPAMYDSMVEVLNNELVGRDPYADLYQYWDSVTLKIEDKLPAIGAAAKSNTKELVDLMKPTKEQLESLAKESIEAGEAVPQNIADGLKSIYYLEAISGNTESLYKLIGMTSAGSKEKADVIQAMLDSGGEVPEAVAYGMELGEGSVIKSTNDMFKALGITTKEQSAILTKLMGGSGTKATEAWIKAIKKKIPDAKQATLDLLESIKSKIETFTMPIITLGLQTTGMKIPSSNINGYATGTVVPANYGKFLGVLGDNQKETEVVSPLSTMKQAFKEAMAESGGQGNGVVHATFNLNGKTVLDAIVEADKERTKSTGKSLLNK